MAEVESAREEREPTFDPDEAVANALAYCSQFKRKK